MHSEVRFEEENKREKESWLKVCHYILWIVMIGIAVFLASRALEAEGKERVPETAAGSRIVDNRDDIKDEYQKAVQKALTCQEELMTYAGVTKKEQRRYSMQVQRLAFLKERKGEQGSLYWCNELSRLTMEAYEKMDEKGRELLTAWQLGREQWKDAGDKRGQESGLQMRELINRLYYQQLKCIMDC